MPQRKIEVVIDGKMQADSAFNALIGDMDRTEAKAGRLSSILGGLGKVGLAGMGISALADGARSLADTLGLGLNVEMENTRAQFQAFTKDAGKTTEILDMINVESAKTPFQFGEMSKAAAGLMSSAKQANEPLLNLIRDAEVLAASNPAEGLEGAAFALREAVSGDFTSIIERFNLPRSYINKLKEEGVPALEIVRRTMKEVGYDMDLVSGLSQTASGRWSTLMDTFDALKRKVSEPIFKMLSEGLGEVQKWLDANMDTFAGWADSAGSAIKGLASAIGDTLGKAFSLLEPLFKAFTVDAGAMGIVMERIRSIFGNTVADAIEPLVNAFMRAIPQVQQFATTAGKFLSQFVDVAKRALGGDFTGAITDLQATVKNMAGWLVSNLAVWGKAFVDWIAPMIPPMLEEAGRLAVRFLDWIGQQVQPLLEQLGKWGRELWAWVEPMIGPLLAEAGKLASRLFGWLADQIPPLLRQLGEWGRQFVEWVAPMIPPLLAEANNLFGQFMAWITEQAPPLMRKFIGEWVPAAIEWVARAAIDVLPKLALLIAGIGVWIVTEGVPKLVNFGWEMGEAIIGGIGDGLGRLASAMTGWIREQISRIDVWVGPFHVTGSGITVQWPELAPPPSQAGASYFGQSIGVERIGTQVSGVTGESYENNARGDAERRADEWEAAGRPDYNKMNGYQFGGIVPGPVGMPQLAIVHGGETVLPAGIRGGDIYITVQGSVISERDLVDAVHAGLIRKQQRNGGLGW